MHEAPGIITNVIGQATVAFLEVSALSRLDVLAVDFNIAVSVRSTLHMEKT